MINFSINKTLFLQALNTTKRAISSKMLSQSFPRLKLMSLQKELPYLDRMAKFQLKTLFLSKMKMLVYW